MKPELRLNGRVLSAMLPDLPPEAEERLRRQISRLSAQKEETPVKKKLSLGLVLALVITLITLSALAAALIGGKDFVENILAPRAMETTSDTWIKKELDELLRIARDNGLPITEELQKAFDQPGGSYKQELIHAVLRDSLGFYYSTWPVEDQAWYENLLVKAGLKDFTWTTVPQPGDVSLQEAREIAARYIAAAWQAEPELMNPAVYRHHQQFKTFKESERHQGRRWYLEFEALDLSHDGYQFTIGSAGEVVEASRRPGVCQPDATAYDVLERYEWVYGNREDWESGTWQSFQKQVRKAMEAHGDSGMGRLLNTVLRQEYALPTDDMITREAAVAAVQALPDAHKNVAKATAVLLMDEGTPVWKVTLRAAFEEGKTLPMPFLAEVNALTGEVRSSRLAGDHSSLASYALDRLMEEEPATPPPAGPARRSDGKPGFWYAQDIAPDYYWKALDEYGYSKGDTGELIASWQKEYGTDQAFWPLEAQALIALWHDILDFDTPFPGLPALEDITREEALAIARKAVLEGQKTGLALDEAALDELSVQFQFFFNVPEKGGRIWQVGFVEYADGQKNLVANVVINAKTGEVTELTGGSQGHG